MRHIFICLCLVLAVLGDSSKVHEQMTPDELEAIFGINHDSLPEYEVVPVAHAIHEKSNDHRIVQLTSFKRHMTLYLEPTDGYLAGVKTPVYKGRSNSTTDSSVYFERIHDAIKSRYTFFQDVVNLAALLIKHDEEGKALIDGIIDVFAIRPLPPRFRSQFKRDKRDAQDEFLQSNRTVYHSNLEDTHHHVIFKIPSVEKVEQRTGSAPSQNRDQQLPKVNRIPQIIHPQILVIMESTLFNTFKQDVTDAISYILSFWNAVDLRYRVFRHPDVRLNIAGIILAEDDSVTPYITKNRVKVTGYANNKIHVPTALRSKSRILFPDTIYNEKDSSMRMEKLGITYDLVITMTPYDMCQFSSYCLDDNQYICSTDPSTIKDACITLGFAYYTGACAYDPTKSVMEAVGIIEDKGAFGGIIPTAHEVGHLLGASHSAVNDYQCPTDDGYLMSYKLSVTRNSFIWSNCSVYSIKKFLQSESRAQCLFNKPDTGSQAPRVLPGKIFSRDEQCDRIMKTHSCSEQLYNNNCDKLYCTSNAPSYESCVPVPNTAVPEGSTCGKGHLCINAQCVSESERSVLLEVGTTSTTPEYIYEEYEDY